MIFMLTSQVLSLWVTVRMSEGIQEDAVKDERARRLKALKILSTCLQHWKFCLWASHGRYTFAKDL